jgi:hypothetical protein
LIKISGACGASQFNSFFPGKEESKIIPDFLSESIKDVLFEGIDI